MIYFTPAQILINRHPSKRELPRTAPCSSEKKLAVEMLFPDAWSHLINGLLIITSCTEINSTFIDFQF